MINDAVHSPRQHDQAVQAAEEITMGFLDRLLGRDEPTQRPGAQQPPRAPQGRSDDEIAVERYQYLLRTAPPEAIEQVHTEAFGRLTPEQRELLFRQLSENTDQAERPADDSPAALARSATRAEVRQPGTLARAFGGGQQAGAPGFGTMFGGSLLGSVAGFVIGSAIVSSFLPAGGTEQTADAGSGADGSDAAASDTGATDAGYGDGGFDGGGDVAGGDFGGGDFGF